MRRIGMRVNWSHLGRGLRAMVAAGTLWAAWAGCQNTMDPQVGELWQRQVGTAEDDSLYGVAVGAGSVYAAGATKGHLLDSPSAGALSDGLVIKSDLNGLVTWQRQFGTAGNEEWRAIAVDGGGNAYVVGYTDGTFAGQTRVGGDSDAVIARIKPDGSLDWVRQFGTMGADYLLGVTVDSAGAVYAVGWTSGTLPGQTLRGGSDGILVKYSADGTQQLAQQLGSAKDDLLNSVTSDGTGALYIGGWATDVVEAGQTALGGRDGALYKWVPGTGVVWARQFSSGADDEVQAIGVAASGSPIYVTGRAAGGVGGQTALGRLDGFVASVDSGGAVRWTAQVGTMFDDDLRALLVDPTGGVYVAGYASLPLPNAMWAGGKDAAFFKLAVDGSQTWGFELGSSGDDQVLGLAAASGGGAFAVGTTTGTLKDQLALGKVDGFLGRYQLK